MGSAYDLVPLAFLTLGTVHTEPPAVHQLQVFPPGLVLTEVSHTDFSLVSCGSQYLPVGLSSFGDSRLPCFLVSLTDLRVVDFLVCSPLY